MSIECPCPAGLRGECCYNEALDDVKKELRAYHHCMAWQQREELIEALRKEVSE